ncbi:hypothetical protein RN001_014458 [Aquatica leii]|uniref:Ragulator complex protein LAMTOR3 n=1 Tax=Aquatica leii TaxID=1421715 RepID=A0AAN7SBM7_9COLE|nr:hypothetical protein RN001_014458 [Aquatica leii]
MVEEIRKVIQELLLKVSGLYCVLITDRDGVPVLKVLTDKAPELATRPAFLSTFGLAIDQGSKLGLGKAKTLICTYSQYQIVQMNKLPLVISFIASDTCNTGHILGLEKYIEPLLANLTVAVADTQ